MDMTAAWPRAWTTEKGRAANIRAGGGAQVVDPLTQTKPAGWTRLVCFGDTRGQHDKIPNEHHPHADVLLHAGNFTSTGEPEQVHSFAEWLKRYPAIHKVVIAGDHDVTFEPDYYHHAWQRYHQVPFDCRQARQPIVDGTCCTYLENEAVEIMGYRIYGSPWQPELHDGAFNLRRGPACCTVWERMPKNVDILITHGPPYSMDDLCHSRYWTGCEDLLLTIKRHGVPVSLAGHIHGRYGTVNDGTTLFVNAATCTLDLSPTNPPIVIDLPPAEEFHEVADHGRRMAADLSGLHAETVRNAEAVLADFVA
mmetsp:Transcript_63179/g.175202  ORF Transcript_63179/g.175202 Transcript_63179/m.175202 type:complete len:309 (+) Transcript_63179:58-984(+)